MKWLHLASWILIIVGALNWGLVGVGGLMGSNWNLVYMILGGMPMLENIVYLLVGLSAVYEVVTHRTNCKACSSTPAPMM